jgi:hypothetical protein
VAKTVQDDIFRDIKRLAKDPNTPLYQNLIDFHMFGEKVTQWARTKRKFSTLIDRGKENSNKIYMKMRNVNRTIEDYLRQNCKGAKSFQYLSKNHSREIDEEVQINREQINTESYKHYQHQDIPNYYKDYQFQVGQQVSVYMNDGSTTAGRIVEVKENALYRVI